MQFRCPGCDRLLEVPAADITSGESGLISSYSSVRCPDCGVVPLPAQLGPTVTFRTSPIASGRTQIAHFQLKQRLGQGGYGEVWLAMDVNLGRQVALKLPVTQGPEMANLMYEAKTAASLRHPHIVSVYEVGTDDDQIFIASEYIDGLDLRDLLSTGKPQERRAVELLVAICGALHYAHQQGVVHRDVKPANILLNQQGQPFIADFGIAKRIAADATISREGQVIGTAKYMSPEQASGRTRETDRRSDVYSIGVLLFEMLTGDVPFRGTMQAILHQKLHEDAPSPRTLAPTISRDLETICLRCLEREPDKRYATAQDVADELTRFANGEPIRARPVSRLERAWRWARRRPTVALLLTALTVSLVSGLGGVTYFWQEAEASASRIRQSLYRAQMNNAAMHLRNADVAGVRNLLAEVERDPELSTLRGFEWHYFNGHVSPLREIANEGDFVVDVAVSHDGDFCAAALRQRGRGVHVWDVRTGELVRTLDVEVGRVLALDFSPVSGELVSGSSDGFIRFWNPLQDARLERSVKHGRAVSLVRYSPDGKRVLSAGDTGAIRVWNALDVSLVQEIPSGPSGAKDVRFCHDSSRVVAGSRDGQIRIWEVGANKPSTVLGTVELLECLAVSDDGEWLAVGTFRGRISIWNLKDGQPVAEMDCPWGMISDVEFFRGSHLLGALASDGDLHVIDMDLRQEIRSLGTHARATGKFARARNGKSFIVGSGSGSVTQVRAEDLLQPEIIEQPSPVRDIAFLPGEREVVTSDIDGTLRIWNLATGKHRILGEEQANDMAVAVSRDGRWLASGGTQGTITIRDPRTLEVRQQVTVEGSVGGFALSPRGNWLAVRLRDGALEVIDTADWEGERRKFAASDRAATAAAFTGDDRYLAVAWSGGSVQVIDIVSRRPVFEGAPGDSDISSVVFGPGDQWMAAGTEAGEIRFWEPFTQRTLGTVKGHPSRVSALAVLPDGRTLVSAGRDYTLKLWDVPTRELITTLYGHTRQVFSVAVSQDGSTIVSGALKGLTDEGPQLGEIRIWRGDPSPRL